MQLDVTDGASCRAAVAATVARFGGLDVLMYGAADNDPAATVLEMDEATWDRTVRINLTGAFLMVKAALPPIQHGAQWGKCDPDRLAARALSGAAARPAYCAAKGALIQLARSLAIDHAAQGIRANTLSAGAIETRQIYSVTGTWTRRAARWDPSTCWAGSESPRRSPARRSIWPATPRAS